MSRVQMFAAAARPLAEVLVDRVRTGVPLDRLRQAHDEDDRLQLDLPLLQDEVDKPQVIHPIRPDEIAAAVLLGRALDRHRDVLARLRDPDLVAVVEVPTAELVEPIARLLRTHVLGAEAPVLDGDGLNPAERSVAAAGAVALFEAMDTDKTKKPSADSGRAAFAAAMQRHCAAIGVASDPERQLPGDLVRFARRRIVVPPLDGDAIAATIEAVTGRRPGAIDEQLVRGATLETLAVAVRADLGAARSLARLQQLLDRSKSKRQGPRLDDLHGLGAAKEWALQLVDDLKDYATGRLPWSAVDRGCLFTGLPGTGKTTRHRR
jgi:hypothetical protein